MPTAAPTTASTFTVGEIVTATSACDSDCVWTFEVIRRTAKFVTIRDTSSGEVFRVGVITSNGEEWARPFGAFSMCPIIRPGR